MPRRRTTIGVGAFGRPVSAELHEWEVLNRIIDKRQPLTEDAVFFLLSQMLKRNNQGVILKCVRSSKNIGEYRYFTFSPDIDLLEIRQNGTIVGYELKGLTKSGRSQTSPTYYDGLDQALAYLINPVLSPSQATFAGSIFDYVYLLHPAQDTNGSDRGWDSFARLVDSCTPIGLATVSHSGTKEVVKPKRNPFVNQEVQQLFLRHLDAFRASFEYKLSLVQT